jgi:hypothetical protein
MANSEIVESITRNGEFLKASLDGTTTKGVSPSRLATTRSFGIGLRRAREHIVQTSTTRSTI